MEFLKTTGTLVILITLLSGIGAVVKAQSDTASSDSATSVIREQTPSRVPPALDAVRPLEVGDKVSFRILEEDIEPVTLTVDSSGEIAFPLVGRIRAEGRTCRAVAAEVKRNLEKNFYRTATVSLALESETQAPLGILFISGQVASQGPIEIPRGRIMTVAQAILQAGGFADFADRRRVRLIRPIPDGGTEVHRVDVKAVLEGGETAKDIPVRPGDYILVPERLFNF